MLSDQNRDSVKKLTFKESAVSRLTQSRMPRLVEKSLIEAAAKKNVANQGAMTSREHVALVLDKCQVPGHVLLDTPGREGQDGQGDEREEAADV